MTFHIPQLTLGISLTINYKKYYNISNSQVRQNQVESTKHPNRKNQVKLDFGETLAQPLLLVDFRLHSDYKLYTM